MTLPTFHFEAPNSAQAERRGTTRGRLRIIGEVFDASGGPLEDGTLRLPAWLRYRCETAGTTAQTSASTVRAGFAAHAPRAVSRDGVSWGLAIEKGATNLITSQVLSTWSQVGTATLSNVTLPTGESGNNRVTDDDAGLAESRFLATAHPAASTLTASFWGRHDGSAGGSARVRDGGADGFAFIVDFSATTWARYSGTGTTSTGGADTFVMIPRLTAASVGAADFWGMQLETGAYPTSHIVGTRAPGSLMAPCEALAPAGYLTPTLRYRPNYTQTQTAGDHTLIYIDERTHVIFRKSDAKIVLTIDGVGIASAALTFSRYQELTVTIDHSDDRVRLIVSGATTGNGIAIGEGHPALIGMPSMGYVLGGPAGAEESAELVYLAPCRSFCDLVEDRMLLQMSREEPHTKFRDLLCALARPFARIFDVALMVRHTFDLDDPATEGDALDKIGSIVGLRREGFGDARYRDFLRIQVELLLAVARDDAEWTGTCENILRIARTFIGHGVAEPVVLRNAPPYSYVLSVPGLDLAEAALLRRFLRTATYAGVLGIFLIPIDGDSLWASENATVDGGFTWDSENDPGAGTFVWGTTMTTE